VREFINNATEELDIKIQWKGHGIDEKGFDENGKCIIAVDTRYYRPAEVETLLGDASKAQRQLGWKPRISFKELVAEMVREDLQSATRDEFVKRNGYKNMDYHE
jgi:GDPmannose 4,6-dehydratase